MEEATKSGHSEDLGTQLGNLQDLIAQGYEYVFQLQNINWAPESSISESTRPRSSWTWSLVVPEAQWPDAQVEGEEGSV